MPELTEVPVIDAHVHFWDPAHLEYPWLEDVPPLRRAFLPADYDRWAAGVPVERIVFVEANPRPSLVVDEARFVERLASADPRIAGIVAFVDLLDAGPRDRRMDELAAIPLVKGIRHNIQGNPPGFCLQPAFVDGVRSVGERGWSFDLCATHDQLADVVALAERVETRLVLDHCGKPAIRAGIREPWDAWVRELAALPHVWCKLSGLLTEADTTSWSDADLLPYADHVVECFGPERLLFGSDWPVATLAARSEAWYPLTCSLAATWSDGDRRRFYHDNARDLYHL